MATGRATGEGDGQRAREMGDGKGDGEGVRVTGTVICRSFCNLCDCDVLPFFSKIQNTMSKKRYCNIVYHKIPKRYQ